MRACGRSAGHLPLALLVRREVQRAGRLGHPFGGPVDAYGDRANAVDSLDDVGAIADAMRAGKSPDAAGELVPCQITFARTPLDLAASDLLRVAGRSGGVAVAAADLSEPVPGSQVERSSRHSDFPHRHPLAAIFLVRWLPSHLC